VISRHWRGLARKDKAASYERHLRVETFPGLKSIPGFVGASILTRTLENAVEFLIISRWSSVEAIAQFAGADVEAAVVPANVQAMMIEYDLRARHYEVIATDLRGD
jgi:heme-degrading monooxygenase HmoA